MLGAQGIGCWHFQPSLVTAEIIKQILATLSKSVVAKLALDYVCLDSC